MDILLKNPQYTERIRYLENGNDYISYHLNKGDGKYRWTDILNNYKSIEAMEQEMSYGQELPRLDI
jgi:hypothetical protein